MRSSLVLCGRQAGMSRTHVAELFPNAIGGSSNAVN